MKTKRERERKQIDRASRQQQDYLSPNNLKYRPTYHTDRPTYF